MKQNLVETSQGLFNSPQWVNSKTNRRQKELISLVWQIKFKNELNTTKNKALKLRKKLIGK